jgi:AcrR family transcriptional regulator
MSNTSVERSDKERSPARQRILDAAFELFAREGINSVGVDTIAAHSGSSKMTLYRHFKSKDALVLAFLDRREAVWTKEWLEAWLARVHGGPEDKLLAIFDAYDDWFRRGDFEGCSFINTLLEARQTEVLWRASAQHLANIRLIVERLAREAGLADVERFGRAWHVLMKGAIIARHEGQFDAARETKATGRLLLGSWPRAFSEAERAEPAL